MSVDYRTFVGRGYELTDADFEKFTAEDGLMNNLELYVDEEWRGAAEEYLHYVDAYCDTNPHFLGYPAGVSVYSGELLSLDSLNERQTDPEQEKIISEIARRVFDITSSPGWFLVSEVF